ncbi:AI-2E family transporter [Polyangium aurulentum]|uniref:AI-2E family transporter n=1 Tax=Polyangium aurulentum TaxID=2567896 RepID=UPI0010AE9ABC
MLSSVPRRSPDLLLRLAALVIIGAALRSAANVFIPILMALLLAVVSAPPLAWLEKRRVPMPVAATLVLLANVGIVGAGAMLVASSATELGSAVPRYQARLNEIITSSIAWLEARHVHLPSGAGTHLVSPGTVIELGAGMVRDLAGLLSDTVVVLLILGFILFEASALERKLQKVAGDLGGMPGRVAHIVTEVQKYLFLKTVISLAMGIVLGVFVALLGVDFALLWGLFSFLLNFIPNVGAFIAGLPPVMLALIQYGPGRALAVMIGFVAVHMVLGNIVEPALMGRRLGLSALVVFLSLLFWGWLWGPAGMFLSVPLTMVARILLEGSDRTRWIAQLLDSNPPAEVPAAAAVEEAPSAGGAPGGA